MNRKHLLFVFSLSCLLLNYFYVHAQAHIFYLHGRIVELQGPEAFDQTNGFGAYLYYPILDSLKIGGNIIHSEIRSKDTEVKVYALKIVAQINSLLKGGILAKNITVIGASKGALIAMYISTYLKNNQVNFVFMAACHEYQNDSDLNWYGNILSIYEKTDVAASCAEYKTHSKEVNHYKEIELNTGLKHGFLYKPLPDWLTPTLQWSKGNYN